jgi:hypothetical protein
LQWGAIVKIQILDNKRLILLIILGLIFVFFVPLQFGVSTSTDTVSFFIFNEIFYLQTDIGAASYTLFRWMLIRYPLSIFLAIASFAFTFRLHQRRETSYPILSASVITLVLWSIPIYFFIQFFTVDPLYWMNIMMIEPVPIGFCCILFLVFVIMPTIDWYSNSAITSISASGIPNNETLTGRKRVILTPKRGSVLGFLAAFLLPGLVLWQSFNLFESTSFEASYLGFLLQFDTSYNAYPVYQQFSYSIQELAIWYITALPILCCSLSLLFAWFIMRCVHGKSSKRSTILVGVIAESPSIVYAVLGFVFEYEWGIIPFPAAFIVGLVVIYFTHSLEPSVKDKLDHDEIAVPMRIRLKSRFSSHQKISATTKEAEMTEDKAEEN